MSQSLMDWARTKNCACPHPDPCACISIRDGYLGGREDLIQGMDACECACHDDSDPWEDGDDA